MASKVFLLVVSALCLARLGLCETQSSGGEKKSEQVTVYAFYCGNSSNNSSQPSVLLSFKEISVFYNTSKGNVTLSMSVSGRPQAQLEGCNAKQPIRNTVTAFVDLATESEARPSGNATIAFKFYKTNGKLTQNARSSNTSFYWELRLVTLNQIGVPERPLCYTPPTQNDWIIAPQNFSFSCQPERKWIALERQSNWRTVNNPDALNHTKCLNGSSSSPKLSMRGLQVQAFSVAPHRGPSNNMFKVAFGAPIDCVGYFSGETLMGFIVSILLLIVLFVTVLIFLSMETPDRFDDAKGKNIQVEK